ncbi:hypothetical protein BDB00DRAFT_875785 [Zychaea mexicana]|uniref:uncharacterized protein n=1 Tax=Zychaea mexicana TaxID=64656 RepID=UPI0022FE907B|nr:uncharacterized protein BDB00DRAFT_875785 [Zychaea mexicana]KAI9489938.1 hypothetical protein BDB00DRAFT_875785 [Zychaea mexicana]
MLCASEQVLAPAATRSFPSNHSNNSSNSSTTNPSNPYSPSRSIPLLHDPYDPRIEQEYEQLVQHWTQQLLHKTRQQYHNDTSATTTMNGPTKPGDVSSSSSSVSAFSTDKHDSTSNVNTTTRPGVNHPMHMDIIGRYLEEQWMDSQHMLECAQAWNGRDTISLSEAVRAMNVVSLRLMQRTLDTRQMLFSHYSSASREEEKGYVPLFSPWISPRPGHQQYISSSSSGSSSEDGSVQWRPRHSPSLASLPKVPVVQDAPKGLVANKGTTVPRISLALSTDDEEEQEMHAPLLRKHQTDSSNGSSITGGQPNTNDWTHDKLRKKPSLQTIEHQAAAVMATNAATSPPGARRPVRLVPSPSAPNCSGSTSNNCCFNSFAPATNYHRYYHPQQNWTEEELEEEEEDYDGSKLDANNKQSQWRSWYNYHGHTSQLHRRHRQHQHPHRQQQSTSSSSCTFCYRPVPKKSLSAGDAEDTRLLPSSSSDQSSTEDNQSMSYLNAAAPDKTMVEEMQQYDDETQGLLTKDSKFSDSGKYLDESSEEEQGHNNDNNEKAGSDEAYNALVSTYGAMGVANTIIRSESSISAFRPISKNLAPRCAGTSATSSSSKPDHYRDSLSSSSSSTSSGLDGAQKEQQPLKSKIPTITKSQSFPSKVAAMSWTGSSFSSYSASRPALPNMMPSSSTSALRHGGSAGGCAEKGSVKERNFVMRSIVSKKESLSKLFSGMKY